MRLIPAAAILLAAASPAWANDHPAPSRQSQGQQQTTQQTQGQQQRTAVRTRASAVASPSVTVNSSPIAQSSGSGDSGSSGQTTVLAVPSPSASGADCPVIGPGIGGQSGWAGGIFSWGYISIDCNNRRLAQQLIDMGHPDVAWQLLQDTFYQVRHARAAVESAAPATRPAPQVTAVTARQSAAKPAYCSETLTSSELHRHPECFTQ